MFQLMCVHSSQKGPHCKNCTSNSSQPFLHPHGTLFHRRSGVWPGQNLWSWCAVESSRGHSLLPGHGVPGGAPRGSSYPFVKKQWRTRCYKSSLHLIWVEKLLRQTWLRRDKDLNMLKPVRLDSSPSPDAQNHKSNMYSSSGLFFQAGDLHCKEA